MKRLSLIFPLVLSSVLSFGQNYQAVYSHRTACFLKGDDYTEFVHVDSVKYQTDSVFYFMKNIHEETPSICYYPGDSWIGGKAVIKNNGDNLFFNKNGDTITLKSLAKLNDSWVCAKFGDTLSIIAEVTKLENLTFLGVTDSVKTIRFTAYNNQIKSVNYELNNLAIQLSKHYGLVKTLNFKYFPNFTAFMGYELLREYSLAGISDPELGIQNITWNDVYDFQIGDEIHITDSYSPGFNQGGYYGYPYEAKIIQKYLSRTDFTDSIVFSIYRIQQQVITKKYDKIISYQHDTIRVVVQQNPDFNKLPGEPIDTLNTLKTNHQLSNCKWMRYPNYTPLLKGSDSCFYSAFLTGACDNDVNFYYKGLGGPYQDYYCQIEMSFREQKPVYSKKGNTTWGTPLVITQTPVITESVVNISPNPAHDKIQVSIKPTLVPCTFELYNATGSLVLQQELNQENTSLPLDQTNGLYIYKIISKGKPVNSGKLIIE